MDKDRYDNPLRQQCLSIPALCAQQAEGVSLGFAESGLEKILPHITRVILTGCGDSYFAANAAVPAFQKYAGAFGLGFEARRCIDVARFLAYPERGAENILVVGISASGSPARVSEALQRAAHYGCRTLALTNNGGSPAGKAAQYRLVVHTPAFPGASPGLRNYYASLFGLYTLAAKLGECRGTAGPDGVGELTQVIASMAQAYAAVLPALEEQAFGIAKAWQGIRAAETVGDADAYPTAAFTAAKFVEVSGLMSSVGDSEDWCHINFFGREPERTGTIVYVRREMPHLGRIEEMLRQASAVDRPLLLVSNGAECAVPQGAQHIVLPAAPQGFAFVESMYDFLPGALLAAYDSALRGETYFRGGRWSEPGVNTIQTSRIEIV